MTATEYEGMEPWQQCTAVTAPDTTACTVGENKATVVSNQDVSTLGAYGCTFILAPAWSLRMGTEDNVLMSAFVSHDCALLLRSEMQPRRLYQDWQLDVKPSLCADAFRVLEEENAGGSSLISESMSMELLARAFGAKLLKTEMQLRYFPTNSAMTDFSIEFDGVVLGVSVTRAISHPATPLTLENAVRLLEKKLSGVLRSTATCYNAGWNKQILHIWARSPRVVRVLEQAYASLAPELIANTLCLVTLCNGLPELFTEKATARPPQLPKLKGAKDEQHTQVLQQSDPTRKNQAMKL